MFFCEFRFETLVIFGEISGAHCDEYEDDSLGCCVF
jgi:hypothetical protein